MIVPSTILSGRSQSATLKNPTDKFRERRDSNPGLLGETRKCYLCAMPPPIRNFATLRKREREKSTLGEN